MECQLTIPPPFPLYEEGPNVTWGSYIVRLQYACIVIERNIYLWHEWEKFQPLSIYIRSYVNIDHIYEAKHTYALKWRKDI